MLTYSHITRHDNIPFPDYNNWQEYSHSFLKYQRNGILLPKEITDNMHFGNLVDALLCNEITPELYASPFYQMAVKHCQIILERFSSVIQHMAKQVCYKGRITYNGYIMPVKVRLDMQLRQQLVFENKITFSGCKNKKSAESVKIKAMLDLIFYMGYHNQLFHQMKMSVCEVGYIMIHSVPLEQTFLFKHTDLLQWETAESWWIEQVKFFGL